MAGEELGNSMVTAQTMQPDFQRYLAWLKANGGVVPPHMQQQPQQPPTPLGTPNTTGRVDLSVPPQPEPPVAPVPQLSKLNRIAGAIGSGIANLPVAMRQASDAQVAGPSTEGNQVGQAYGDVVLAGVPARLPFGALPAQAALRGGELAANARRGGRRPIYTTEKPPVEAAPAKSHNMPPEELPIERAPSRGYQPTEQRAVESMAGEGPAPEPTVPVPEAPASLQEAVTTARQSFKGKNTAIAKSGLRDMDLPSAIQAVRANPHLQAREPDGSFVGAPRHIKDQATLDAQRAQFDEAVRIGSMIGGDKWYDEGRKVVSELTRGEPKAGSFLAGSLGVTSAQATPETNLGFELQGHNAWEMGEPRDIVRTGASARNLNRARDLGTNPQTGLKTGVYQENLDPSKPWTTGGTNDIWHARALGYTDEKGKPWDKALSGKQHAWMDAETIDAVRRANERGDGGRKDWKSHEIQAAAWVGKKAMAIQAENPGMSIQDALKEAQAGYRESVDKHTAFGTYDHIPGAATGHLPGVQADQAKRQAYTADPASNYKDKQGYDIFYKALNPRERPGLDTTSVYQSKVPGAPLEVGTGGTARPLASLKGKTGKRTWDQPSEDMLTMAEGTRAYVGGQEMGAASMLFPDNQSGARRSVAFKTPSGQLTPQQVADLKAAGEKYGVPDVVHLGEQGYLTRFGDAGAEGATDLRGLREGIEGGNVKGQPGVKGPATLADQMRSIVQGADPARTDVRSTAVDYSNQWKEGHGSGAVTAKLREVLRDNPLIIDKLDASPEIRANALAQLERDERIAAQTGDPVRVDLQNARRLIHAEGFRGLFNALDAGKIALPTTLLAAYLPQLLGGQQQPSGGGGTGL
jgi:hypothetical protein